MRLWCSWKTGGHCPLMWFSYSTSGTGSMISVREAWLLFMPLLTKENRQTAVFFSSGSYSRPFKSGLCYQELDVVIFSQNAHSSILQGPGCLDRCPFLLRHTTEVYLFVLPVTALNDGSGHFLLFPQGSALKGRVRRRSIMS